MARSVNDFTAARVSLLVGAQLLLSASLFDAVLLGGPEALGPLRFSIPNSIAGCMLLWMPLAAWFGSRVFAADTVIESYLRPSVRLLRALCLTVPVLNWYAMPAWHWLTTQRPVWLIDRRRPPPSLDTAWQPASARLRRTAASQWEPFALCSGLGVVLPFVWTWWFLAAPTPRAIRTLVALDVTLHVGGAVAWLHHYWPRGVVQSGRWLCALGGLTLLAPVPVPFAGMLLLESLRSWDSSWPLSATLHDLHRRAVTERVWSGLRRMLHAFWRNARWWRQWRRPGGIEGYGRRPSAMNSLLSLARLKTLLVGMESAAATAFILVTTVRSFELGALGRAVRPVATLAAIPLVIGVVAQAVTLTASVLRVRSATDVAMRRPWARYALLVPLAFLCGLGGAVLAATRDRIALRILVTTSCIVSMGAVFSFLLSQMINPEEVRGDIRDQSLWAPGLLLLGIGLASALCGGAVAAPDVLVVLLVALCSVDTMAGVLLGAWLLHPYAWRHIRDPRVPPGMRVRLAVLATSAVLPCGGVAVPFWFHLRPQPGEVPPEVVSSTCRA